MTVLADTPARVRALTDLKTTLLVEAAAGTGKTALMADCRAASSVRARMCFTATTLALSVRARTWVSKAASEDRRPSRARSIS